IEADMFEHACRCLGKHKAKSATSALIDAMQRYPRFSGIPRALGDLGDPAAGPALLKNLRVAEDYALRDTISALGSLRIKAAVDELIKLLPSEEAAESLGLIGDARALEPLRKLARASAPARLAIVRIEAT